jgi:general stress protein YciG
MANTTNNKDDKTGKMTVQEAGQKGGEATSESHDKKFYEGIGHQGGEATIRKTAAKAVR